MALLGCISFPQLALQILLQKRPGWRELPAAVVREEKPMSPLLLLNEAARKRGARAGMRFAEALSIVPDLRAAAAPREETRDAMDRIIALLATYTPEIEPCPFDPDALWVNVAGLQTLFVSLSRWIVGLQASLSAAGYRARIVVGYTRLGTYVIVRSRQKSEILASEEAEREAVARSGLSALPLSPRTLSALSRLSIRTVRDFLKLPRGETLRRFGGEARAIVDLAQSSRSLPIQPVGIPERATLACCLETPAADLHRLMPHVEALLDRAVARARARGRMIVELGISLHAELGGSLVEVIRPAEPASRSATLRRLAYLRLSGREYPSAIERIELSAVETAVAREQGELFSAASRDLDAGARAFALIRARFGNDAVVRARIVDSHLPELAFRWEAVERPAAPDLPLGSPCGKGAVRRILEAAKSARGRPGASAKAAGPFAVSTGWWSLAEEAREYSFERSAKGEILWVYRDEASGALRIQGVVD